MKPDTRSYYVQAAQRIIEHVSAHLDEALDLQALASEAALSPFHFHRVFLGMVGETPVELVRRLRLERAAWQVVNTPRAVTEIAFDSGYETHEAFTRAFRASYGTSPTGFRRRRQPRIELAATCGVHFRNGGPVQPFIPRQSGARLMDVQITQRPALRVAAVRHVGPYNQIPLAFERLGELVNDTGLIAHAGVAMLAIYHDDPDAAPVEQLRSDAAIVVPEDAPLPDGLTEQRVPGGTYATTTHIGPYEQLGDAWARFMGEWLPASGRRVGPGVSYEIYRNTPGEVPSEALRTELYIPLAEPEVGG